MKFSEMIYTRPDPAEVKSALAELTERLRAAKSYADAREVFLGQQAELRHIRADGYAMDYEEVEVGLSCVAVPVFSAPGQVSCSISISGMTPRVRTALRGGLLDDLRQASADISRSLYGYQPADDLL